MKYTCPVCGYGDLRYPPADYTICPSCGTEFGNTDFEYTWEELRNMWIRGGYQWHSRVVHRPRDWNPMKQLEHIVSPVAIPTRVSMFAVSIPENIAKIPAGTFTFRFNARLVEGTSASTGTMSPSLAPA